VRAPGLASVIVPTYRAGAQLGEQLSALAEQDYAGAVEVIVADNEPDGASKSGSVRSHPGARVIDASARRGPGAARNAGARAAKGDFLAFCDADDRVSPSWLRLLVESAADADLVGGCLDGRKLNGSATCDCYELTDPAAPHLGFLPTAAGANLGIWTDVFHAVGGFTEESRTCEDVALVWSAQLRGYRYAASNALVHKRLPAGWRDAARRFFHYGIGDAWLYRRFRAAGMPRRDRGEVKGVSLALLNGFAVAPESVRWCRWNLMVWLTLGRLVGSVRYRVAFL
jgi:glycosyltransferase involved in cell wall biosynthesis